MRMNRFVATCAILACALGAAGCFESLTSIATPDKVVFYPDLVGDYRPPGPGGGRVHTHIARAEGKAYTYVQYDDKGAESTKGTLRLVKLGEHHFFEIPLDTLETEPGAGPDFAGRIVWLDEKFWLANDLAVLHLENERGVRLAESAQIIEWRILIERDVILFGLRRSKGHDETVPNELRKCCPPCSVLRLWNLPGCAGRNRKHEQH